jgi:uncharacterized iron-regulated protein
MTRHTLVPAATIICLALAGCTAPDRVNLAARTGGSAFLFNQFQAFDGNTGRALPFKDVVQRCRRADVIVLGEQHGNAICNQLEAQLLYALLDSGRPVTLAMEFFETDTQTSLDAYLAGRLDEPDFLKLSHRHPAYLSTHRPLIELCRAARVPVMAANAPRRLVSAYRKSELTYEEYRAGLDPADRQWLPAQNEYLAGDYRDRFAALMQDHSAGTGPASGPASQPASQSASQPTSQPGSPEATPAIAEPPELPAPQPVTRPASESPPIAPASMPTDTPATMPTELPPGVPGTMPASAPSTMPASMPATMPGSMPALPSWQELYRAQLLWDQAMADSVADCRDRFPDRRVMLVVGGFHVARDGGTVQKFHRRRPDDKLLIIVYRDNPDGQFTFDEEDRGAGDVIIYGLTPPEPEPPSMPVAPGKPASQPAATQPAETRPAESQPFGPPASLPASTPASAPAATAVPPSART